MPSRYWIERTVRLFDNDSGLAGVSGRVIRDGAPAEAVSWEEADRLVGEADGSDREGSSLSEARDLYGCNMAFRMSAIGTDIRFDERLVLYGWLEDKDFSRIAKKSGRLAKCDTLFGVHLGLKQGRVSGTKFGYSQIVNPWYLCRKGTLSAKEAWSNTIKALAVNGIKTFRPETFIDRRGRFKGNVVAVRHLLVGDLPPRESGGTLRPRAETVSRREGESRAFGSAQPASSVMDILMATSASGETTNTPGFALKSPLNPSGSANPCHGSMQMKGAPGFVQIPR